MWGVLIALAAVAWATACSRLFRNPRHDPAYGLTITFARLYARVFHQLRISGLEHVPTDMHTGPLLIVANHTAGIDPILVQSACPFHVRWMMANDMMLTSIDWFWKWVGVISVNREGRDTTSVREAIRALQGNEVVGIFPEGGLERPARQIRPFHPGVGLIIAKTKSPVLAVIIEGTPQINPAWASLRVPSRSRITFKPMIWYEKKMGAAEIAADLRDRFHEWTGWAYNDTPPSPDQPDDSYV